MSQGSSPADCTIAVLPVPGGRKLQLSGSINETFPADQLASVKDGILVLDLDGVSRISSFGVREWMRALKAVSVPMLLTRCRPVMVSQMNMVAGFTGNARLVSFYAPVLCDACGHSEEHLLDLRRDGALVASMTMPDVHCPKCGQLMTLDDLPDVYFGFPASQPTLELAADEVAALTGNAISRAVTKAPSLRAAKHVQDDVTGLWLYGTLTSGVRLDRMASGLEGTVCLVLSGITSADREGTQALCQMVANVPENVRAFVARAPVHVLKHLEPKAAERLRFLSLELPFHCASCSSTFDRELDLTALASLVNGSFSLRCTDCSNPLTVQVDRQVMGVLGGLRYSRAQESVRAFLDQHRQGPPSQPQDGASRATRFGNYELVRPLGSGGMAEVLLARHKGPEGFTKEVVLKRILPQMVANPETLEMFLQEARLVAQLRHPNVVQTFELGRVGPQYFIAMEYVRGRDLATLIRHTMKAKMAIPVEIASRFIADACAGLQAAHEARDADGRPLNIIHRDISPQNILVSSEGDVKLADFGVASVKGSKVTHRPGTVIGKLGYLAPELLRGQSAGPRSDIFALGVTFAELLSQRRLFRRKTELDTLNAIVNDPLPDITKVRPDIPPALWTILSRALEKNPDRRYHSALDFHADLEGFLVTTGKNVSLPVRAEWLRNLSRVAEAIQDNTRGISDTQSNSADLNDPTTENTIQVGEEDLEQARLSDFGRTEPFG